MTTSMIFDALSSQMVRTPNTLKPELGYSLSGASIIPGLASQKSHCIIDASIMNNIFPRLTPLFP